jgi:hypothetical protein
MNSTEGCDSDLKIRPSKPRNSKKTVSSRPGAGRPDCKNTPPPPLLHIEEVFWCKSVQISHSIQP